MAHGSLRREVIGRDEELVTIDAFLREGAEDMPALLIEGEAGIGKTRLWEWGVARARDHGHTVLVSRPAEGEVALPFAGLSDLLGEQLERVLPGLPEIPRTALDVALLRRRAETVSADRLACSLGVLGALEQLAEAGPTLLAIDDVQWLDAPTARVCEFACRRLTGSAFRILLARRAAGDEAPPLGLTSERVASIRVGALPVDELGRLLVTALSLHVARPRLLEIHAASAGNPYFALEIGRALLEHGPADDGPLPVPGRIGDLLRVRLDRLSGDGRAAALLCAASTQATAALVERAAGGTDGLEETLKEHVLELDGARLRFTHPLLASIAYASASPWERRAAHDRLAVAATEPEERARHLALATEEPDESIAGELEAAAGQAAVRGAPETAATLMERAAELTAADDTDERNRRLVDAVQLHVASGDPTRARRILEQLVAELPPGPERADLLVQLADLGNRPYAMSIRLCEEALEEAVGRPDVSARAEIMLAITTWIAGDLTRSTEHSRAAARYAAQAGDDLLVAVSLADLCLRLMILGFPYAQADMERALELELRLDGFPAFQRPSFQLGLILAYTDAPEDARPLLRAELERLERAGNASWQISVLFRLADLELRAGNWAEAAELARRSLSLAMHAGIAQEQSVALMIHGLVQSHIGNLDEAEDVARRALELAEEGGDRAYAIRSAAVLGFVELSRGDAAAALDYLTPATAELRRIGVGELSISQVVQNEVEALVLLGRLDEAEETIAFVEEKGRPTGRSWHEAVAERGRALVAAARSDVDAARRHLELALAAHERLPQPFERSRTLLVQGQIERRAKRRAVAREALTQALEIFDQLGATHWAEKAAAELARISGRRPAGELTETERRVAELVAQGLSNKEVAARLFVSVRAVEANLSKIYAKLGIRSRTQLAARL